MSKTKMLRAGKWTAGIAAGVVITAAAGLAGLIIFGTASQPPELKSVSNPFRQVDFSDLPKPQQFKARDGEMLSYRLYPGTGKAVVVLIHGSSGESTSMHAVAKALNAQGDTVYVPDVRGHGHDGRSGDCGLPKDRRRICSAALSCCPLPCPLGARLTVRMSAGGRRPLSAVSSR
jgi:pimeloyl-ACP methyl ester carboxylesterase